ncbi:hypothetical protein D9M68_784380 [compost metagenome]
MQPAFVAFEQQIVHHTCTPGLFFGNFVCKLYIAETAEYILINREIIRPHIQSGIFGHTVFVYHFFFQAIHISYGIIDKGPFPFQRVPANGLGNQLFFKHIAPEFIQIKFIANIGSVIKSIYIDIRITVELHVDLFFCIGILFFHDLIFKFVFNPVGIR